MHAGGFREKWKDDMFDPKVLGKGARIFIFNIYKLQISMDDPVEELKPINLDQLYLAFGLLVIGIILGYLAFMIEIIAGWINNKILE